MYEGAVVVKLAVGREREGGHRGAGQQERGVRGEVRYDEVQAGEDLLCMTNGRCRRGVNLGVSYIQVHRWIDEQGLELRLEVKAVVGAVAAGLRGCGFGAVSSGLEVRSRGHFSR